jgi:hypothetical protein
MIAAHRLIRLLSQRFLRWLRGDQRLAAADEVGTARFLQRLADLEVILRLEELHHRSLQFAVAPMASDEDVLVDGWINAGVIHAGSPSACIR